MVDHDHLELTAIRGIDDARSVHQGNPVLQRETATWHHHPHVPDGNCDSNTRRNEHPTATCRQVRIDSRMKVESGIIPMGLGGQR